MRLRKKEVRVAVIPDIHGRTDWQVLADEEYRKQFDRIVFLGDYVDAYNPEHTVEKQRDNLLRIVTLAGLDPKVILLLGNHDVPYAYNFGAAPAMVPTCSGMQWGENALVLAEAFKNNSAMFSWAFKVHDVVFVHAGFNPVTWEMFHEKKRQFNATMFSLKMHFIWHVKYNDVLQKEELYQQLFAVSRVSGGWSAYDGIFWERYAHSWLGKDSKLPFQQVVGHTKTRIGKPILRGDVLFCDCWQDKPDADNRPIELVINGRIQTINGNPPEAYAEAHHD